MKKIEDSALNHQTVMYERNTFFEFRLEYFEHLVQI
jgi:hypothetical protein